MQTKNNSCIEYVVIIGTYVNACSITEGLKKIGYAHGILMVDPMVDHAKCMAEVLFPNIPVVKKKVKDLKEIVSLINDRIQEQTRKIILMTSEEFIEPVRKAIQSGELKNAIAYTGSGIDNELIFDRFRFYQFIEKLGIHNIPRTVPSNVDPVSIFGNDYIIRVNKSWDENKKLPRLRIVHSKEEKLEAEQALMNDGLTPEMWSYQELLSTADTHNISVCGWYDDEFRQFGVTRKIIQHPPKVGNGDVIEIYHEAPDMLINQTETILKALQYRGAFEMEYVLDEKSNEYKLIELNPRFWMQHGLIENVTDYALIRRAIGQNQLTVIPITRLKHMYWVNGSQALFRLIKGHFGIIKYIRDGICVPSLTQSIQWGVHYWKYIKECK